MHLVKELQEDKLFSFSFSVEKLVPCCGPKPFLIPFPGFLCLQRFVLFMIKGAAYPSQKNVSLHYPFQQQCICLAYFWAKTKKSWTSTELDLVLQSLVSPSDPNPKIEMQFSVFCIDHDFHSKTKPFWHKMQPICTCWQEAIFLSLGNTGM